MHLKSNIFDTALIFEGGGMRASYSAGFVNTLLEQELFFDYVAGISAGASHTANYLSRDVSRTRRSFVDLAKDPQFGGWRSFLRGEGFFRAEYIYERTPYPDAALPYDYGTFEDNPARFRIGAFDRDRGKTVYFSREDIGGIKDLMKIVRASSSMPVFMQPTEYRGLSLMDGGLGEGGGIALPAAKRDGFQKFFVVLTREKGYRKAPIKSGRMLRVAYWNYPELIWALENRHNEYNRALEELRQLELEGKALLVYPETMPVSNRESNYRKLSESYSLGHTQGMRELPRWKEFLGIS